MLAILSLVLLSGPQFAFEKAPPAGRGGLYVGARDPLTPTPFEKLPIGSIRPEGWLRKELQLEAAGFTGHLDELSRFLEKRNNAWLSPTGEGVHGWEEVPYWLRGFGDLGYVLGDKRIEKEAKVWINAMLASQQPDGYFGPKANRTGSKGKPDVWPNMLALNALQSYYEFSGDKRVLDCMLRYFKWEYAIPNADLLTDYWEHQRQGDNIASVLWLYNRTPAGFLLDLARKLDGRGAHWSDGVANWHGVNFAQGFREPAEISEVTHDPGQRRATQADFTTVKRLYGQVPGGMWAADENARRGFTDPRQAAETCTMVESMWSDEMLLTMTGDVSWADRCEDVAFNSLPASMTPDERALHYLTAPNLVRIDANSHAPDFENGGPMLLYNPYDHRCCQHNSGMGWPYFAEHLWLATPDGGLTAALYAPNTVQAKVGEGATVKIEEKTHYPFTGTINFAIDCRKPTRFKLRLRIPEWIHASEKSPLVVKVNHAGHFLYEPKNNGAAGQPGQFSGLDAGIASPLAGYVVLDRMWKKGDRVVLTLPMQTAVASWPAQHEAVSVGRGPLWYSLKIGEKTERGPGGTDKWPTWTVTPTTPWNYGLLSAQPISLIERPWPTDDEPFTPESSPIELVAQARKIDGWQEDYLGTVGTLQDSPAQTTEPVQKVTLIPMGAARLRISVFPTVVSSGGHDWKASTRGHRPLPTKASFINFFDSIAAPSDGIEPRNSHDATVPRFTWWDHKGRAEWIEYDLPSPATRASADVYWYDDSATGGGCRPPESWKLLVLEDGSWREVQGASAYGTEVDRFNHVTFAPTVAAKWRIAVQLRAGFSGGILEWKLGE